jgi:hypothetical protein
MSSPMSAVDIEAVRSVVLQILSIGLLRIRTFGAEGLADRCAIEADHLHNLPEVIRSGRLDLLDYYYEVERLGFIDRGSDAKPFEMLWEQLKLFLNRAQAKSEGIDR